MQTLYNFMNFFQFFHEVHGFHSKKSQVASASEEAWAAIDDRQFFDLRRWKHVAYGNSDLAKNWSERLKQEDDEEDSK